jgi:hypothetical protein
VKGNRERQRWGLKERKRADIIKEIKEKEGRRQEGEKRRKDERKQKNEDREEG